MWLGTLHKGLNLECFFLLYYHTFATKNWTWSVLFYRFLVLLLFNFARKVDFLRVYYCCVRWKWGSWFRSSCSKTTVLPHLKTEHGENFLLFCAVDSQQTMEETILVGDDLMLGPPSPIIPPEIATHVLEGVDLCDGILRNLFLCKYHSLERLWTVDSDLTANNFVLEKWKF